MKYLKTIGQFLCVNIQEVFTYIGAALGGGAFGILIAIALVKTDSEPVAYATAGTLVALIFSIAVLIFAQSLGGQSDFYVTVSMNRARIPYFLGRYLLVVIDILAAFGIIKLVELLERKVIGPAISTDGKIVKLITFKPEIVAVVVLVVPLVTIFCTAMYVIFERKFFWALWGVYMLSSLGIPRVTSAMKKYPGSFSAKVGEAFASLGNIGVGPWIVIGTLVTAVLLIADIMLYKKMEVKL